MMYYYTPQTHDIKFKPKGAADTYGLRTHHRRKNVNISHNSVSNKMSPSHRNTKVQDLCYYKLLHFLGKCFAILPNFQLDSIDQYKSNTGYAIMVLFCLCGIYAFGTYGKVQHMKSILAPSFFLTEIASDLVIVMANIVTIVRINISKGRTVCQMLGTLIKIDTELRIIDEKSVKYPSMRFVAEFIFILSFFVLFIIYNIYIWMATVGWEIFRFFFLRDVQNFQVLIACILLSSYAVAIRNRACILNKILLKISPAADMKSRLFTITSSAASKNTSKEIVATMRKLRSVYVDLMTTVDHYNNIFGWVHLVFYVNIVITLLNPINLFIVYGLGDTKRNFPGGEFDLRFISLCIIWASLPGLIATWMFSACDVCIAEIKKVPNICNALVQEFYDDEEVTMQLEKLAQQAANSCPEFSAAGFYNVNYNIYFSLMGSITTYLIVLLQFR